LCASIALAAWGLVALTMRTRYPMWVALVWVCLSLLGCPTVGYVSFLDTPVGPPR
jgi:hypothetical protein